MKIKKGDHVVVVAGKDKGASGTVIAAYPDTQRVLVQGVNMIKKNTKVTNQGFRGAKETVANMAQSVPLLRQTIMLPGCGHWTQQERAAEVNAAMIAFLRSL